MHPKIATSMKRGIKEGGVSAISSSLTETYIPQFAIALKASAAQIGWLSAIPSLLSPLAQLLGDKLMSTYTRKQLVTVTTYIQAFFFIPIALIGWCISTQIIQEHAVMLLLISYTLLMSIAALPAPAWFSWMGDLIPKKQRGAYFSKRHKVMGIASMAIILGGLALDYYQTQGLALSIFGVLFTIAALIRVYSAHLLSTQYEPPYNKKKSAIPYSLWHFLKQNTATRKFVIYVCLYNLVMYIASPFFPIYLRQDLGLSYTWITLISLASSVFYILALPYIGTFSDKYGNLRLFYLSGILYALNPLVWLLFPNPWILLAVQLVGGIANAAYLIGVTNYLLNTVPSHERAIVATYLHILAGVGIFIGSLVGGYAMTYHPSWLSAITYTFIISIIGRCAITFIGIKHMREREKVQKLPHESKIELFHPFRSLQSELYFLKHLKK
ncbi:MFS transporter [Candidatus Pacearchaeota archaeon]|nr:MFS transporter [Candidatus Pacearchaeota archaeon]